MAALRLSAEHAGHQYVCRRLPDGRIGNFVRGWGRAVRDDVRDTTPHGTLDMERGLIVSCNAYFAQLATYQVGADALHRTADLLGITVGRPNTPQRLRDALPQAAYGQGEVLATPFQMARAAATVANGGVMPFGRWVTDETNLRVQPPQRILDSNVNALLARYMRETVTRGTGREAGGAAVPVAGKTGTAEIANGPSHAWFIGFAPATGRNRIAFAVLIENGRYGGSAAAPLAATLVSAAAKLGTFRATE
jgi:peptidoglycan glycosyltransferase